MSSSNQSYGASSSKNTLDHAPETVLDDQEETNELYERYLETSRTFGWDIENIPGPSSTFYAPRPAPAVTEHIYTVDGGNERSYSEHHEPFYNQQAFDESFLGGMDGYGLPGIPGIPDAPSGPPPSVERFAVDATPFAWDADEFFQTQAQWPGSPQREATDPWLDPSLTSTSTLPSPSSISTPASTSPFDAFHAKPPSTGPCDEHAALSPPARPYTPSAADQSTTGASGSSSLSLSPEDVPRQCVTPPPLPEEAESASKQSKARPSLPASSTRRKPAHSGKRKRDEPQNVPHVIPAESQKRTPIARHAKGSRAGLPAALVAPTGMEPPRKRRKHAELENTEMTEATRCGLDGCGEVLRAPNVNGARQHFQAHFEASPATEDAEGAAAEGSGSVAKNETEAKEYRCSYIGADGTRCKHAGYASMLSLQRHVEGHHYGWGYKCPRCGRVFNRRDALLRHQKSGSACTVAADEEEEGPAE